MKNVLPEIEDKNKGSRPLTSLQGPKNNVVTQGTNVSIRFLNISKLATVGWTFSCSAAVILKQLTSLFCPSSECRHTRSSNKLVCTNTKK